MDNKEPSLLTCHFELNPEWVTWYQNKYPDHAADIMTGSIGIRLLLIRVNLDHQLKMIWKNHGDMVLSFVEEMPENWVAMQENLTGKTNPSLWKSIVNFFKKVAQ